MKTQHRDLYCDFLQRCGFDRVLALPRCAAYSGKRRHFFSNQGERIPVRLPTRYPRAGFSMLELVVAMAVIAVLAAILAPAVARARQAALKTQCMNNLRNVSFGLTQFDHFHNRLPASGYYYDPPSGIGGPHHSWAVAILPFLDQENVYKKWKLDRPITDPVNAPLARSHIPAFACPVDLSLSSNRQGDLSYAVNGGWGFTYQTPDGVRDCPMSPDGPRLDLNGDGSACAGTPEDNKDRALFKHLGLFFLENWKPEITPHATVRHHSIADILDGSSQTFLVTENVRAGIDPNDPESSFATPDPYRSAFYIGTPCRQGNCSTGNVDYAVCNQGNHRINSGLWKPEGSSPVPNSFHEGGVYMAYADGHIQFLSESVDGAVYAALASPQGRLVTGPIAELVITGDDF